MPDLITVARAHYAAEAESIRLLLESYEIPAVIYGENTGIALAYMAPTVGIRVQVQEQFAERARQIIESEDRRRSGAPHENSWYCGPCREEVEAGFETCWSCGQPRAEVERPFPHDLTRSAEAVTEARDSADETVRRAWRATVLGLATLPMITHVYSLGKLLEASGQWSSLTESSKRLYAHDGSGRGCAGGVWSGVQLDVRVVLIQRCGWRSVSYGASSTLPLGRRLEEFDGVAGGVFNQDLLSALALHDVVAKVHAGLSRVFRLRRRGRATVS